MFYECTKWFLLSFLVLNSLLFLQYFIDGKNLLDDDLLKIFFRIKNETPLTIPISTFLAVLFAFSFLSKNNELIALDSTGISTFFILRPILILALVSTFVNLTFFDYKKSSNEFFNGDIDKINNHVAVNHSITSSSQSKYHNLIKSIKNVNSFHNYSINKLGNNLIISAVDDFENIEAIEHKKNKIFGLMWHPERKSSFDKEQNELIKYFFNSWK